MTFRSRRHEGRPALFDRARALESRLAEAMQKATSAVVGQSADSPLEIVDRACDDVARYVHPAGRGRQAFPFNDVCLTFAAPTPEVQAQYEAICSGPPALHERVLRRLAAAGCENVDMQVRMAVVAEPGVDWPHHGFHVGVARTTPAPSAPPDPSLRVELVVTHGTADRGSYAFTALPIAIGRGAEVRDSRDRLIRMNDVAFLEGADDITASVSRRHARIELDGATGRPRVIDDNSARGTSVIRHGRGIVVPRGSRGLALQTGDEIVVGRARLLLNLVTA